MLLDELLEELLKLIDVDLELLEREIREEFLEREEVIVEEIPEELVIVEEVEVEELVSVEEVEAVARSAISQVVITRVIGMDTRVIVALQKPRRNPPAIRQVVRLSWILKQRFGRPPTNNDRRIRRRIKG